MSENTKIEWCTHSWSPWRGCTKLSPGCANCYADALASRFGDQWGGWGKGKPRVLAKNWNEPVRWDKASLAAWDSERGKGLPTSFPPRPTVFPSLCDWLDEEVPIEWLARFLALIRDTPNLTWLLLTKRPENFEARIAEVIRSEIPGSSVYLMASGWLAAGAVPHNNPPANVWIGTSVEDQPRADERIPALLRIPAAGRFLSVEPLLGPVDFGLTYIDGWHWPHGTEVVDWVIIGGESGPGSRPCNVDWIRSLVRQCKTASVPVFVKQLGAVCVVNPCRQNHFDWRHETSNQDRPDDKLFAELGDVWRVLLNHKKGGDPTEWPEHLRVREFPTALGGAR